MKIKIPCLALLVISLLLLEGCCDSVCVDDPLSFVFNGFEPGETDTVRFTAFVPNGNFNDPIETIELYNAPYMLLKADLRNDWRINLPGAGLSFKLTEIKTKNEQCSCDGGNYLAIKSFLLDGKPVDAAVVTIEK